MDSEIFGELGGIDGKIGVNRKLTPKYNCGIKVPTLFTYCCLARKKEADSQAASYSSDCCEASGLSLVLEQMN